MARLPRLYAPRIPQLIQARFAHPLAPADAPAPAAALDRIRDWLAEEISGAGARGGAGAALTGSVAARGGAGAEQAGVGARGAAGTELAGGVALHAWIVLPDQIALLATPGDAAALSRLMQALGRRMGSGRMRTRVYAGRYRNALLEPGRWVLPAMVWVESLAVSTGQVSHATQWPWSSAAEHAGLAAPEMGADSGGDAGPALTDHPDYWREGDTPFARQAAWRTRLAGGLGATHSQALEAAVSGQWALGEKIFLTHLGRLASRRVSPAPRGRPRKTQAAQRAG